MSEFKLNILPFNIIKENIDIYFYNVEKNDCSKIHKNNLPKEIPVGFKESVKEHAWWSINNHEADIAINVNLTENKRFAKHYFNRILFNYFQDQNILTNRNFISDTVVYCEDKLFNIKDYKKYNKFSIRVDNNDLIEGTSLLLSYDRDSFILNQSVEVLKLDDSILSKVLYKNRITKFLDLTEEERTDKGNIYSFVNREIRAALGLAFERNYSENKYKKYYEQINQFYETYLKDKVINNCIKIVESGFYKPNEKKINHTSDDSNLLLFGNNQKNFTPYIGIKEYGPLGKPPERPIKFIFIFHKDDNELANKVYSYLKKGYKSFPGLESFVNIDFQVDTSRSIKFTNDNPFDEIKEQIEKLQSQPDTSFPKDTNYAALYISRIRKDTEDEEEDEIYYSLKELLLHHFITSQVIYRENINNPSFNYFLPNIAIALLAKLGGIPWRLYRPIKNDLVVGIGADRSLIERNKFIGCAFCFRNDGSFQGFNVVESGDTTAIAESIKEKVNQYIFENKHCDRLIIHYYKKMSWEEEEPIRNVLEHLNLSLPYVIVTINESRDYVLFDNSFDGEMPQSGTFVKIKRGEFIICNNTRYSTNTASRIEGFPLPVKIKLRSPNFEKIDDTNIVRELIDQVYQFSRMYWKSVRQRNMPVTIEYSELVAKMFAHFHKKELEQFAKNSLWFL